LHLRKKSDLVTILVQDVHIDPPESIDVKLLDGAIVVHLYILFLSPRVSLSQTLLPLISTLIRPHIIVHCKQVDIVCDKYISSSIKESTREKHGKGILRKVAGKTKLPGKWADFLLYMIQKINLCFYYTRLLLCIFSKAKKSL